MWGFLLFRPTSPAECAKQKNNEQSNDGVDFPAP
jgi:hypothetical protein